jgi:hypothetical protein
MIPWLLIAVGGVMIYSGIKGDNPLSVIKSVLANGSTPAPKAGALNDAISPGIQQRLGGS